MTLHNKLVRDNILSIITSNGATAQSRIIQDDNEYLSELCKKLIEEAREVQEDPSLEELADTLEVILALGDTLGYSMTDIEQARQEKAKTRGRFNKRIFLISTEEDE